MVKAPLAPTLSGGYVYVRRIVHDKGRSVKDKACFSPALLHSGAGHENKKARPLDALTDTLNVRRLGVISVLKRRVVTCADARLAQLLDDAHKVLDVPE